MHDSHTLLLACSNPSSCPLFCSVAHPRLKSIPVEDSYTGVRMESDAVTPDFAVKLLEFYSDGIMADNVPRLHARYVLVLLYVLLDHVKDQPSVNRVQTQEHGVRNEVVVVGDPHGQLKDLVCIFKANGLPSLSNTYVFNGDFIDRGKHSMEVLLLLAAFSCASPGSVFLNRGNHEDFFTCE